MAETSGPVNPGTAFEPSDWALRPIGLALFGIFLFLLIAPLVLIWAYPSAVSDVGRSLAIAPPAPQLQTNPPQDLANFAAEQKRRLETYYWIDRDKGVVHLPIEDAMNKLVRDGSDGFPKAAR